MTRASDAHPPRLLIAEGRSRTRRALAALLAGYADFEVVGEASDGLDAIEQVRRLQPDVVLLGLWLPCLDCVSATVCIKADLPSVRVVTLSLTEDRREEFIFAGADAFVLMADPIEELVAALRRTSASPCFR